MASNVSAVTAQASQPPEATATKQESDVSKEVFLELLVAQIRYQDPLNPTDGAEYMAQLAEFSGLEQMIAVKQELQNIHETLKTASKASPADDASAQNTES